MVIAFWGIFLWGISSPKVGEAIVTITLVGVAICVILVVIKLSKSLIDNSK